jgi:lysophospholipid acyltransferase (LPLAT)-like uncharacterized protein
MSNKILKRRLQYLLLGPLVRLLFAIIWSSCRVRVEGESNIDALVKAGKPFIPCYWHQHHFFCSWYMRRLIQRGLKIGFLISPSRDGDIPAKMARSWGGLVIRGSTTRTGAQAMRDMYNIIVKDGVSPVTTSDGPQGPIHVFKLGDILLSQFTQAPLLPLSYAANRAWQLKSWDKFLIPKPFAKIVITIGEPVTSPKGLLAEDLEPLRLQMQNALKSLTENSQHQVGAN